MGLYEQFSENADIKIEVSLHVECVVLLSQLPDEHIDIDINLDELT